MATQIQLQSTNYNGQLADITFYPCSGGTISLGYQTIPFTYTNDNYEGTYDLFFSAFSQTCQLVITCPTPTPTTTTTPTVTPTNTPTVTPTNTSSPTPTPTLTPTPSPITPFSPTSISGITTWFEPTSGVTKSGGFVTNWIDQIGGRNATSTNPTNFTQSNILNSYSGITSPNNNVDSMTFTLLSQSSLTIFSVSQRDALGSNNPQYLIGNASGQGIGAAYDDGTGYKPFIFDGPSGLLLQGGIDPITPKYTTYQLDTSFGQIRQNGTQVAVNAGNPNPQLFTRLFENSGAGFRALQGTIWEIIIYNRILTAPEITQVETYLSTKYGL